MSDFEGEPGNSAQEKYDKMAQRQKEQMQNIFGKKFGGFLNVIGGDDPSAKAWKKGAEAEQQVGRELEKISEKYGFKVMHDRRIPQSNANIDHIMVSNRGVFVIDTKHYSGPIDVTCEGALFERREVLRIGRRDQTKLVLGVKKQVAIVEECLEKAELNFPVRGVLAFYMAEWASWIKPDEIDGVLINGKGVKHCILSGDIITEEFPETVWTALIHQFKAH